MDETQLELMQSDLIRSKLRPVVGGRERKRESIGVELADNMQLIYV